MDNVGFKTWTEDGRPQVHNNFITWGLVQSGSATLYDDGMLHPQPVVVGSVVVTANAPIIAIRPVPNSNSGPYGPAVALLYSGKSGNQYTFHFLSQSSVPVTFDYWVFDNADAAMIDASMDDVGGRVYNTYGQKTFDASMSMLRPITWVSPTGDSMAELPIPSGKSYAVAFVGMAHHVSLTDTGLYSDTVEKPPETDPGEGWPGLGPNTKWRQQDSFNAMGMVSIQNGSLYMGMTTIEEYRDWFIVNSQPFDKYEGQMGFAVIDVTGFAGGGGTTPGGFTVNVNSTLREVSISGAGDSVTPSVTISIVGGSGTPTITWLKKTGGSVSVQANGAIDGTSFNTKVVGQAAGTVNEAYWYARVVRNGITAYSPDVLFRHTTGSTDTTPDTISPMDRFDVSSNEPDASWSGSLRQITGINTPINLRFERYNYTGDLNGLYIDVFTAPSSSGPWTHHGYFNAHEAGTRYLDVNGVTNGTWIAYNPHAVSLGGRREGNVNLTIWNLSAPGGSVKISDVSNNNFVVDADYVAPDYTPNAITLANQSVVTNEWQGYTPGTFFQITGINQPITIRITRGTTTDSGYPAGGTRRLIIGKSTNGGVSYVETNMGALSAPLDFTANNGDWFFLKGYFDTAMGTGSSSWTTTVTNATTGANMGSITVSGTVDADNNHNVADPTPDSINVNPLNLVTNDPTGVTSASFFQITGINQAITLRFTRDSLIQTGNAFTRRAMIFHSTTGSGGPWTQYNLGAAAGAYIDIATNNGDWFYVQSYLDTTAGKATATWWNYITNLTTGQQLASFFTNATVDNDNNYNVTALAVTVNNPYSYIRDFAQSGQFYGVSDTANPTVTGGLAPYTAKWTRTGGAFVMASDLNTLNPTFYYNGTTSWSVYSEYQLEVTDSQGTKVYGGFTADWAAGDQEV